LKAPARIKFYEDGGLTYTEIIRQEYGGNNSILSAGFAEGENKPEVDSIYIKLEKDNVDPTILLLRPDEAQALAWISSGVIWSHLMELKIGCKFPRTEHIDVTYLWMDWYQQLASIRCLSLW
jgi:hypothetical protein